MAGNYDSYVPQIQPTERLQTTPVAHASPDDFGAAQGEASLGQGLQQFAQDVGQVNIEQGERAAMAWSAQAVGKAHSDMLDALQTAKNNAQPGAPGFTDDYAKQFDGYANQLIQNAPTQAAKQFAQDRMGYLRARMVDSAQYFQENEQDEYQLGQYSSGIQDATNAAVKDPTQLPNLMASMRATYANAPMQPMIKRRLDAQVQQMPYMVMDAMTENSPQQAKAALMPSLGLAPVQGGAYQTNQGPGMTVGDQNNNPGNIKASQVAWEGKVGQNGGFEQFATPEAGVRAATVNAQHILRNSDGTLSSLVNQWAPPSENNTPAYLQSIVSKTGIPANQPVNPDDPAVMGKIMPAIFQQEGTHPTPGQVQTGISAAFGQTKLPEYQSPQGNDVPTGNFNVDAIPVQQRIQLLNKANAQMERQNTLLRTQVGQQMTDDMAAARTGQNVSNPIPLSTMTQVYGDQEGPRQYKIYANALQDGQTANSLYTLPVDDINAKLEALKPQPGEGFAQEQASYNHLVGVAQQVVQQRQADPQAFAQMHGLGPQTQLDFQSVSQTPDKLAQGIAQQVATAHTMTSKYWTPFQPLSNDQAKFMGAFFNATDPNTATKTLQAIVKGAPNPDDASAILGQIKETSPVIAKAGDILAHGDTSDTPALLVQGANLLKQKGSMETYVGKANDFSQAFDQQMGNAYANAPQARAQDLQATMAYYAQQQAMAGKQVVAGTPPDPKDIKSAISAVVGNTDNFNGSPVIVPRGMDAPTFHQQMVGDWDRVMTKSGVNPQDVPVDSVSLQRISDGEYAVMHGNGPVRSQSGQPVFVHFSGVNGVVMPGLKQHPAYAIQPPTLSEQPQATAQADTGAENE